MFSHTLKNLLTRYLQTDYLTILTLFFSKNLYGLNVIGFHVYNCMTMHYDLRNRKLHTLIVKHTIGHLACMKWILRKNALNTHVLNTHDSLSVRTGR